METPLTNMLRHEPIDQLLSVLANTYHLLDELGPTAIPAEVVAATGRTAAWLARDMERGLEEQKRDILDELARRGHPAERVRSLMRVALAASPEGGPDAIVAAVLTQLRESP